MHRVFTTLLVAAWLSLGSTAATADQPRVVLETNLGAITVEPDPFIEEIVKGWPQDADFARATALGLPRDQGLDEIVAHYMEDYLPDR